MTAHIVLDPCEQSAIVPEGEVPRETPRHPWHCSWRNANHATCRGINHASASHCQKCGRPYTQRTRQDWDPGRKLAESISVSAAIAEFQRIKLDIAEHYEALAHIERRLGILFVDQSGTDGVRTIDLRSRDARYAVNFNLAHETIAHVEREIWWAIIARSGVRKLLSDKRAREVDAQLESGELPPLTAENVEAWMVQIRGTADELLREKVSEVFSWLRPNTSYKTNSHFELGKKVVLEYVVERADPRWSWKPTVNHRMQQMFSSMESLFRSLDGHGQQTRDWKSDLAVAIGKADPENAQGETEYFTFRVFRNGNGHIGFKRPDLVAKLNAIAGGKNLKGKRCQQ